MTKKIRFIAISDIHDRMNRYPYEFEDADVLIDAGDISTMGDPRELYRYNLWLDTLPVKHKILIPGNHDFLFETDEEEARKIVSNATVLIDQEVVIDGIKIYGAPWQPRFYNWAFNLSRGNEIAEKWKLIPDDADIVVTHGPPYQILDRNPGLEHCGCYDLRHQLANRVKPKYHIFGHIHFDYGRSEIGNTVYLNASVSNEQYHPVNRHHYFEMEVEDDE